MSKAKNVPNVQGRNSWVLGLKHSDSVTICDSVKLPRSPLGAAALAKIGANLANKSMDAQQRIQQLESELKELRAQLAAENSRSLKSELIAELAQPRYRLVNPGEFYQLFCQGATRGADGQITIEHGGLPRTIGELVDRVKTVEGRDHHFRAETPATKSSSPSYNPFNKKTWNLTQQGQLFRENRALYDRLKAEAS